MADRLALAHHGGHPANYEEPMLSAALLSASLVVSLIGLPFSAWAEPPTEKAENEPSVANGVDPLIVDEPSFPQDYLQDRVRIWVGSTFAPSADFEDAEIDLARPELRFRTRVPVGEELSFQITGDFRASVYDVDNGTALFADCAECPTPSDFYAVSLGVQGGYHLNREWSVFRSDERWALLAALYTSAQWEPGAFEESVSPGLSIGVGYELPGALRIALAARVERALDGDGVSVGPSGYLRWDPKPYIRLRTRGLGFQLEYRPEARWEVFVAGFRSSDRFRLDRRPGAPSGMTFRDRQVTVGGGMMLKIYDELRLLAEAGAIVDRKLTVAERDDGSLDSVDGDPSPYFALRLEIRP
jgi:hypothetical protein